MKKVVLIIAGAGFQPIEYGETKKILQQAGFEVITASNLKTAISADGVEQKADLLISDLNVENYDALYFIGGPGALENLDNELSWSLLKKWQTSNKPYGAICISPRILAKAGVLSGHLATGWDGDGQLTEIFMNYNVNYVKEPVVVDGLIVTANGQQAVKDFAQAIIDILNSF